MLFSTRFKCLQYRAISLQQIPTWMILTLKILSTKLRVLITILNLNKSLVNLIVI